MAGKLDTRGLIFRGHGAVGALFTSNPWLVALTATGLVILCLHLPAWLLGLGHVFDKDGRDVGFFVKYHWSLFYPLLAPVLIVLGIFAFRRMRDAVYQLIEKSDRRIPVIVNEDGSIAYGYPEHVSKTLASWAGRIAPVAALAAIVITAIDTKDLWPGFFNGDHFPDSRVQEWDTAFRPCHPNIVHGGKWANFAFDLVAYGFQTSIVFLGLFFLLKYWAFLRSMIRIIDARFPPYRFEPWVCDKRRRLGLKPLGWVFNLFLAVVVLYQVCCLYHRIELIDSHNSKPLFTYVTGLWEAVKPPKKDGGDAAVMEKVWAICKLPTSNCAWSDLTIPSTWVPLIWMLPPILVVCVLPLGRLFWYLRRELDVLTDQTGVKLAQAKSNEDRELVKEMEERLKCLQETTIWPNGSLAGNIFLILSIALLIGSICPPLLLWGLTSGVVLKWLWSRLGKSPKNE